MKGVELNLLSTTASTVQIALTQIYELDQV